MKQTLQKLTSRKFLLSAVSMIAGIAALYVLAYWPWYMKDRRAKK